MSNATWTDEMDAVARPRWQAGERAQVIGARIGKSRMAVIGRADREGWGPHPNADFKGALARRLPAGRPALNLTIGGIDA